MVLALVQILILEYGIIHKVYAVNSCIGNMKASILCYFSVQFNN